MPTFFLVVLGVLLLDRGTKMWVVQTLAPAESLPVVPDILHLTYVRNSGAAFGLLRDQRVLLVAVATVLTVLLIFYARQVTAPWARFGLGLLVGGALGNLVDRILEGAVIDFIDFRIWPVFNVADSAIVIGVILAAGYLLWGSESSGGEAA